MAKNKNASNNGFSANLLPKFYQTNANKKFLQSTIDQLYQPGTLTKTSGYIGRKNAKASTGKDVYVAAADATRQNYQLEPAITIKDSLDNITFFKDYQDYINQINVFGGNITNHARLNEQEFYSWDPHIDWDKFVNFQNYYWLPYGPTPITIYGQEIPVNSAFSVSVQAEGSNNQFVFTPDGLTPNPVLTLYEGQTYTFNIDSPGNPFSIKTARSVGSQDRYNFFNSISNYGVEAGIITFTVPVNAPTILYYQSENDINLGGTIQIFSSKDDTALNVEAELLGKSNYTLSNGTRLSNGMKLNFKGQVTPASYATGEYYVEGVGTAIKLIRADVLEIVSPFTISEDVQFDYLPFDQEPFDTATGYAGKLDYIVINRSSKDHNPWSRYNRWFHKDVITASASYSNNTVSLDQTARAKRPIIEFQADLRLFNFGTVAIEDIDVIDTFTTNVFSVIEGSIGYNIDGVQLAPGMLVLFTADTDPLVQNKVFKVEYIDVKHLNSGSNQIHLVEMISPMADQTVLIHQGIANQGSMYWFDGTSWYKAQQKTNVNQPPLFDILDNAKTSFGNKTKYSGSTFAGTPLFSYKIGSSSADPVLGFPLSYLNVNNIGDIVFTFNLATDTFQYKNAQTNGLLSQKLDVGFLSSLDYNNNTIYLNGWQKCNTKTVQAAVRIYDNSGLVNNFDIDIFDDISQLTDLIVKVYVNGIRLDGSYWNLDKGASYYSVVLNSNIALTDVLTIRAFAQQPINGNGFYEIPVNLQSNPLNEDIGSFTLGEVSDHVNSIIDNIPLLLDTSIESSAIQTTVGQTYDPDHPNIRDLGNITQYGVKFVQHSGPSSLSIYHITSESFNIIRALEQSRNDYNNFKRLFVNTVSSLGVHTDSIQMVELTLNKINANKPTVAPYYLSDMVPYGANTTTVLTVVDYRIRKYPLTTPFNLTSLSNKAVGVYVSGPDALNKIQLLYGLDYIFDSQGLIELTSRVQIQNGDLITTIEYDSTDGSFVPATPTKLGLWPKYEPKKYLDTTLITPQNVLQGHDGSIILAYNDYRDDIILELEKRIFNNIKVEYDKTIFDLNDIVPSYNRSTSYSRKEFNEVLSTNFYTWVGFIGKDLTTPLNYNRSNSFTYNYSLNSAPDGTSLPGYWRGVYRWLLDTDRPNICPWEMLGFTIEPSWWTGLYGSAPYTSDNVPMWTDIAMGIIREPNMPTRVDVNYAKPFLNKHIPVDSDGNLVSPQFSGLAAGLVQPNIDNNFIFGDGSPVETAWTRSSYYPFSVIKTLLLLTPSKVFGVLLDRSNIERNLAGQLVYKVSGLRIAPGDIILPSVYSSAIRQQTAGLVNYVVDLIFNYIFSNDIGAYNSYLTDLSTMVPRLSYRVGAFTNKDQFNLLLESKTPSSSGNVFIPAENYKVFLNKSSSIKKLTYSGVIITKLSTGFEVKGYSITQPYFKSYAWAGSGTTINVGGISESYTEWTSGQQYIVGMVVLYSGKFYRTNTTNTSGNSFNTDFFTALPSLPMTGGVRAVLRTSWDKESTTTVPYGTLFNSPQDVVDFLLGYGEYLKDEGFVFDGYNNNLNTVSNWETSTREFLFWTTQNWSTGQDKWSDWEPNQKYSYATIVRYNGDYYSALQNLSETGTFEFTKWNLLPGLSIEGASVISLSPAANFVSFNTNLAVVDSITSNFNSYEIFKVNGTPFEVNNLDSYRQGNSVNYTPKTADGIFGASFYLVQHEHVIIIDNATIFNDVIYNPASGYRQERLKISGYTTTDWYGGLDIPGFVFDSAIVSEWQQWKDYNVGDVVSYQSFYYSAEVFIAGTAIFNSTGWVKLDKKPVPQILPNWTNIATQFQDFYGLEVDGFNTAQQTMAQHLIGYQKRQYLNNIIQDDVSEFKFYQGMIREKGTQNVLNKLFGVLNSENKESLTFYEEWAIRVAQYGASNAYDSIEFTLDQSKYSNNPQGTLLTNRINNSVNAFIIQQTPNDVYVSPLDYNSTPFPELPTVIYTVPDTSTNVQVSTPVNQFLRSAGYVDPADVFVSLGSIQDLVSHPATQIQIGLSYKILTVGTTNFTQIGATDNKVGTIFISTGTGAGTGTVCLNIAEINEGAYFWCAFDASNSWNVYRFTDIQLRITSVSYAKDILTLTTQYDAPLTAGSYIGISQVESIQGFYKIDTVALNKITISAPGLIVPSPFTQASSVVVYSLLTQRTEIIDTIDNILPSSLTDGNTVWTDTSDAITNNWASWKYKKVFQSTTINSPVTAASIAFSNFVAVNTLGNIAAVSVGSTQISTYDKISESVPWTQRQLIQPPFNRIGDPASTTIVSSVAISPNGLWMATGSPTVGQTSINFKGTYNSGTSYITDDIVLYSSNFYQALFSVPTTEIPSQASVFWNQIFYVPVSSTAQYTTGLTSNGMITLYKKDSNNNYQLVDSIVSPALSNEEFGSILLFDNNNLYISATSYSNNTGRVYKLSYQTILQVTSIYDEVNSSGTILKLTSTKGIAAGMTIAGFDLLGINSAFNNNQVVDFVLTRLLFTPVTGSINNILNTSSTSINFSKITIDSNVSLYNNSYNYNIPNLAVVSTGLTSINVLSATLALTLGGIAGTNTFNISSITGIAVGYLIVGQGVPTGSYVGAITPVVGSFKITMVDFVGAIQNFIVQGTGSYQFYKINSYNFVEIKSQKDLTAGEVALPVTTARFNGDSTLTFTVFSIQSSNTIVLSSAPDLTPKGELTFSTVSWAYNGQFTGESTNNYFGKNLALSTDGSTLAVSSTVGGVGKVYVYASGTLLQTIIGLTPTFGTSIALSTTGAYLAISDNLYSTASINQRGSVGVYQLTANQYSKIWNLKPHYPETNGEFGSKISFMNDAKTLVVYSQNGSSTTTTTYDSYLSPLKTSNTLYGTPYVNDNTSSVNSTSTTFDKKSTNFITTQVSTGRVDVYDRYNTNWVYSESLTNTFDSASGYGQGFAVSNNNIFVGLPSLTLNSLANQGQLLVYTKPTNTTSWNIDKTAASVADVTKVKNAFLYSKSTSQLLTYLDIIDPLQGKIAGPAEEEIKFKSFYDPASYSYSNSTVEVTSNSNNFWSTEQKGQLWWDLRTTKFIVPYFNDPAYKNNTWNTLASGASVDIYEWIATSLLPSQWDTQSLTPAGNALGISGQSLYGDNAYSVTKTYNTVTKTFKNTYYYWVKNKINVPRVAGRNLSAQAVANLIANPRGQGYTYLALLGTNAYSLVNASQYLKDTDTVLALELWTTDKIHRNVHSQWKLISADDIVQLPKTIQQKWIDSLCGVDDTGRSVPDVSLPTKLKYGIENRPRQGMFVNRIEALKEFIEGVNAVLLQNQITNNYNIEDLYKIDPVPNKITGLYDNVIDTDLELSYASINLFVRPVLQPVIVNGRITNINIINTGRGYLQAPYIIISGTGQDALVRANIDILGRIQSVTVLSAGIGYDDNTTATVRDYSLLVRSDSQAANAWSIYSFDPTYTDLKGLVVGKWNRVSTQAYDVTNYWTKTDWYASGYNQFTAPDFSVQLFVDLDFVSTRIGDIVKVVLATPTQWMLLEKYANVINEDWTLSYRVIGIKEGTIQFNSTIYQTNFSAVGYDAGTFDSGAFDVKASTELRIILNTIQNKILIGTLYKDYLDLFFRSVKYAHSEQPYIDWIFKTSFVRATHNVGSFSQPVYYPVDNLSNFQDYVAEVKPYRTKIREYISQYTNTASPEISSTAITDFDLPPVFANGTLNVINSNVADGVISVNSPLIHTYPWKFWLDTVGFKVIDLQIVSGGAGYITQPQVVFTSIAGSGASAQAFFTNGVINRVILLTKGNGYLSAPTIELVGGLSVGGTPAKIVAIIGLNPVRSVSMELKFDRIGQTTFINDINAVEILSGSGSQLTFDLTWAPDIKTNKSTVNIFNKNTLTTYPVLTEEYKLLTIKTKINGATHYSGKITFNVPLKSYEVATVNYIKDIILLNAADRINFYYNPDSGMLGKELNQLMTGIDYGGTIVGNLGFETGGGWGIQPYNTDNWDSFDPTFTDYTITQPAVPGHAWVLPTGLIPAGGTKINVYWSQRIAVSPYPGDGVTINFPYDIYLYPTVFLTTVAFSKSLSLITTTATVPSADSYPISTTVIAVATATAGAGDQGSILLDNTANILIGQFVSGTGVPYNTQVIAVTSNQVVLSQSLAHGTDATGNVYSFFELGTILTVASTSGITPGLGIIGKTPMLSLSNVLISSTNGDFTCDTSHIIIGDWIKIGGSFSNSIQNGSISGFISNNTYYVIATDGSTQFTLSATPGGDPISTTIGSTIGLTFSIYKNSGVFSTQIVNKIINATTLVLSKPPTSIPAVGESISMVSNAPGTTVLTVDSTALLKIGDVVSAPSAGVFGINCAIASIDSATQITLTQILYNSLNNGIPVVFTRSLITPIDVNTGLTGYVQFSVAPPSGTFVNIVGNLDPVRIDADDFDPVSMVSATNPNAVMSTIISNGVDGSVSIPSTFATNPEDRFIFRQQTSDGSILPSKRDTDISGGDLAYSTATGIAADDIVLDGDGLVTSTSSPAPEEVVPGQVVDTLAIKVFDRSTAGSAKIKIDNYFGDGSTLNFAISNQPVSNNSIIVKVTGVNGHVGMQTINVDYFVDFENSSIKFNTPPSVNSIVSIFNIGISGQNILDFDYFVGDGNTTEFITQAPWLDNFTAAVFVDGVLANVEYFKTDSSYILVKSVGIRFTNPPATNSLINYYIVSGNEKTFAITNTERIYANGSKIYTLNNLIGNLLPNETYMIVRVNDDILPAPINSYFIVENNNLSYSLDTNKVPPYSVDASTISVLSGNNLLLAGRDYYVDLSGITINITTTAYSVYQGQPIVVSVLSPTGYTYNASTKQITFSQAYDSNTIIEVNSAYEHDTLTIERTEVIVETTTSLTLNSPAYYKLANVEGGLITLERTVIDENYVWLTKNSKLLIPGVDYKLNDDNITIQLAVIPALADVIEIIFFGSNIIHSGIAYMQFKDMLNRTSYTRLSNDKRTTLAAPLLWTDTSITLIDASNFQEPDVANGRPGVVEIQGERIEYFSKVGNILSQLRRSVLGTGIAKANPAGTYVQDIGSGETIPYKDTVSTSTYLSDGTNFINLDFIPAKGSLSDPSGVSNWFTQRGYTYLAAYNTARAYSTNSVVVYSGNYYFCTKYVPVVASRLASIDYTPASPVYWSLYNTTIPPGYGQNDSLEVFVGGYNNVGDWTSATEYVEGVIVNVGSYTYRCVVAHTSGLTFTSDSTNWTFFIGNIRLKKLPYSVFNINNGPKSPEGDYNFDADFAIDGTTPQIRLTNKLDIAVKVSVYQKTGVAWDGKQPEGDLNILDDNSGIAEFIKAKPGIWYAEYNQISNTTLGGSVKQAGTFDASTSSFDNSDLTMDQG